MRITFESAKKALDSIGHTLERCRDRAEKDPEFRNIHGIRGFVVRDKECPYYRYKIYSSLKAIDAVLRENGSSIRGILAKIQAKESQRVLDNAGINFQVVKRS